MYAYEICYKEDGISKGKGFKNRDKFDAFVSKLEKKANVQIVRIDINVAE